MEKWSKPGKFLPQPTRSAGKLLSGVISAFLAGMVISGCVRPYVSTFERTATAVAHNPPALGGGEEVDLPSPSLPVDTQVPTVVEGSLDQPIPTPEATAIPTPLPTLSTAQPPLIYTTQAGDFLQALAARFGVTPGQIISDTAFEPQELIPPGTILYIPDVLGDHTPTTTILPDSEIVFSPSALDFDIEQFVRDAGGYLQDYREYLSSGWASGAEVIERVAIENSINPRILLALVEYQSKWVYGQPANLADTDYPMGYVNPQYPRLYRQLSWAVSQLSIGYYGWRAGILTELTFPDGEKLRIAPEVNAGSVALKYLFSRLYTRGMWNRAMYGEDSLPALFERMFGDPWQRAQTVEPLYPTTLKQPDFTLPYLPGHVWEYTGGPHSAWGPDGALAALDFAPPTDGVGCKPTSEWATAIGPGVVVRSSNGVVVVDMDGDGYEQTGWAILYLHIASEGRVPVGTTVSVNDRIGKPSCEGGRSTGTHLHLARKYNGEWILADGPVPFTLSGWRAISGGQPYLGYLVKGNLVVEANQFGSSTASIPRPKE